MSATMSIGELGRLTGTKVNTVRYYEDIGLLPKPARTSGGRRIYDERATRRLSFIRHARNLGFPVDEVRSLLVLADEPERDCGDAAAIARRHLQSIEARIVQLNGFREALVEIAESCAGGRSSDCRIIEAIAEAK